MNKYLLIFFFLFWVGHVPSVEAFGLDGVPVLDELRGPLLQLLATLAMTVGKWLWDRYVEPPAPPSAPMPEGVELPGGGMHYPNPFTQSLR